MEHVQPCVHPLMELKVSILDVKYKPSEYAQLFFTDQENVQIAKQHDMFIASKLRKSLLCWDVTKSLHDTGGADDTEHGIRWSILL